MKQLVKLGNVLKYKLLYTAIILMIYLIGKEIPLYGIDISWYLHETISAETILMQTISGDLYKCSIFALGIAPFMISSIVVQMISACKNSDSRARVSQVQMGKLTLKLSFMIAVIQAIVQVQDLQFCVPDNRLLGAQWIAGIEMVTGAMLIIKLASNNKRYGIGGQSALILVNIIDGIWATLQGAEWKYVFLPFMVSLFVIIIMIIMENAEKRIPVQRISVHNIYADKNYMAIKLNPIGVLPVMFSTAFFTLPTILFSFLQGIFPSYTELMWWEENITLSTPLGIGFYAVVLFCVTIGFVRITINPKDMTEQYLKSGDSLVNIHAGHDTQKYLSGVINRMSFFSAAIMCICLIVPMLLQLSGIMESRFTALPSSVMMLTGIWCNLQREFLALRDLEAYQPFI